MKRKHILIVLIALLMMAAIATTLASAEKLTTGGSEQPEAAATPAAPGFYLVGSKKLDPLDFHQSGDMQFFTWAELNPAEGVYDFAPVQQYITDHYIEKVPGQPGKLTAFSLTTYDGRGGDGVQAMPAWLRAKPGTTIHGVRTEQVRDGNFEDNNLSRSWTTSGPVSSSTSNPHGGSYAAKMGDQSGTTAELIQYSVRIPKVLGEGSHHLLVALDLLRWYARSGRSLGRRDPRRHRCGGAAAKSGEPGNAGLAATLRWTFARTTGIGPPYGSDWSTTTTAP